METKSLELLSEIKQMRLSLGLSQRALGELIGKNRDAIKDIENGRKRPLAEDYLKIKELLYPKEKEQ
jgi:DNA-binding XRE family transcriptional regulator